MAVFCLSLDNGHWVQMAPRETFGSHFYIPALDLVLIEATFYISISATLDNTVVIVHGDYDQMDVLLWTGDNIVREVVNGTVSYIHALNKTKVI